MCTHTYKHTHTHTHVSIKTLASAILTTLCNLAWQRTYRDERVRSVSLCCLSVCVCVSLCVCVCVCVCVCYSLGLQQDQVALIRLVNSL